ncbi:MAG: di-trans,poly-cis-decaprenylcistransferase [Legionella sp. 40-6]|nr:di-trans,poly-cis-decaprenylcistransferase [Legionella sp.]OJY37613.1 MAG: di-trans,poly-cis-decaprenylcistransferase [Legionella sp. 40-6]
MENFSLKHLAIIMDGNRRWAKKRGLPPIMGHIAGSKTALQITKDTIALKIPYLTLFAFSTENWKRKKANQSSHLVKFILAYLTHNIKKFLDLGIKVKFIGCRDHFSSRYLEMIEKIENTTANETVLYLLLALDYGGRDDIVYAAKHLAQDILHQNTTVEDITEELFSQKLMTAEIPDPDLVIRTGGDIRVSNFLLWQAAYAEFYFCPTLWPDFNKEELKKACMFFEQSTRNHGQ